MKDISRPLPVFQLTGGNAEQRSHFLRRLAVDLEKYSLKCQILTGGESVSLFSLHCHVKKYDLIVADATVMLPMQAINIRCAGESEKSRELLWCDDKAEFQHLVDGIVSRLNTLVKATPVWGCVLIGGKSSRMGRPKHLLPGRSGTTWVEHTINMLNPMLDGLVISGGGHLPDSLQSLTRLADVPGVVGPLAGVLAACRWQPMVSWLLIACDMPNVTGEAVRWLLDKRYAGCWGVAPRQANKTFCEPLLSWYDMRAAQLLEEQVLQGNMRLGAAAAHPKIDNPVIPGRLRNAWQNVNTPEQLKALEI